MHTRFLIEFLSILSRRLSVNVHQDTVDTWSIIERVSVSMLSVYLHICMYICMLTHDGNVYISLCT